MPSLRRIHSSPSVRASPYPSSLSSSSAISSYVAVAPRLGPRRTASDSYRRRVLADIEWWRVLDGQHVQGQESVPQLDQAQVPQLGTDDVEPSSGVVEQARTELLTPSTPVIQPAPVTDASESLPITSPFSELSISAIPLSTPPRLRHERDSSSSVESSPDQASGQMYNSTLRNILFADVFDEQAPRLSMFPSRSLSFDGVTSQSQMEDHFGDIVCL